MKPIGSNTKNNSIKVFSFFVSFISVIFFGCSYYFEFKITGEIDNYDSLNTYSAEVRTAGGHKIDGMQLNITNNKNISIQFGELNSFPKKMNLYKNDSVYCRVEFEFDWRKKEGYIYSESTGQRINLKKQRKSNGVWLFSADGFNFIKERKK